MALVQCEIILFAAPMFALLREVSTDGRYLGYVFLMWTFPMSTLALIIGPKVVAFRRAQRGAPNRLPKRGHASGVRVSGLTTSVSGRTSSIPTPPRMPTNSSPTPKDSGEGPRSHTTENHSHSSGEEEK